MIKLTRLFTWQRLYAVVIWLASSVLALIIVSWSATDCSPVFYSTAAAAPHNWCGSFGATISGCLWYLFGIGVLSLPILGAYLGWIFWASSWAKEWDRVTASLASIVLFCIAAQELNFGAFKHQLVQGGLVGMLGVRLLKIVSPVGFASVILYALLLAAVIVATRLALLRVLSWLITRSAWCAYVLTGAFMRTSAQAVVQLYYWMTSLWQGTRIAQQMDLLFDEEQQREYSELHGIESDAFWKQFSAIEPDQTPITPAVSSSELDEPSAVYQQPDISFLPAKAPVSSERKDYLASQAALLEQKLAHLGVQGRIRTYKQGPVITLYEYEPTIESKLSKIVGLEDDLALALQAHSVRIIAPIPGTPYVGFEVANKDREAVLMGPLLRSAVYQQNSACLPLVLGVTTTGAPVLLDLTKMPHLLVAGSTGSGKSVALNTMLMSLLCKLSPHQMRLILIDPKRLEFSAYADIPHLLFPVVTQPAHALQVLKWVLSQMESRYETMAQAGAKNIQDYNSKTAEPLPYFVVVIDELADLMMTTGKQVEDVLTRLAQMARAAGIHLIVATQRPSVDVITGLIKVNFPSRIAFRVTSKVDSRTILDEMGAERLLGKGDMLFMGGSSGLQRLHGAYLVDEAILKIIAAIKKNGEPNYIQVALPSNDNFDAAMPEADESLYQQVEDFIHTLDEVSISLVQRKFRIGYNRSARIIELLQARGKIVSAEGGRVKKVVRVASSVEK